MIDVVRMITVPTVHKKVQQWTQEQQHVRKNAKQVRGVFGNQEEGSDGQKGNQCQSCLRP
jgi:Cys-tRNA synthase (O-phospho-L-seryl-tRNA:Cys-tRNA synthase)